MSESSSEESDITRLSHIASSTERHSSAVDIACDVQISYGRIARVLLPGTSIDLQSALTLLVRGMDKMESIIASATKTDKPHERITSQEQDKVSLHSDSLEHQGDYLGEEVTSC